MTNRTPTTLHEHFRADPRGADSFGKWVEDRIWELLQRPARLRFFAGDEWKTEFSFGGPSTVAQCMLEFDNPFISNYARRVILLDGTIIRKWAAASEATTDQASKAADQVGG